MNLKNIFFKALKIEDSWYIKSIDLVDNELIIDVDFKVGPTFGDDNNCNDICTSYKTYGMVIKTWRHLDFLHYHCFIRARVPRIKRDDRRVRLITPPWAGLMNGLTLLFESYIFKLTKEMPVSRVSNLIGVYNGKI
jgi:hypothetical protein